ncbi:MAG: hypothetical protein DRI34_02805 [Deltaproteobacteria bacterium]|nr:MAG: hypothetical protein DRI34_02805 [Deltaproteobacteria bacterium]
MVEATDIKDRSSRVLVVDDEQVVWDVISNALERPGLYLVYAPDGEQALSLIFSESFDLIIADKNLPGITGLDVIRQARATDPLVSTLIITAYASRESAEEAMAIGIDDYLVKPFELQDLRTKVDELLDRRARRRELARAPARPLLRRSVLVCEPGEKVRRLLVEGIRRLGHAVRAVQQVSEILDALREKTADVIVCSLEILQKDSAGGCFLRSGLLVRPDVILVTVANERGLQDAVQAAGHGSRRILYRSQLRNAGDVSEQLVDLLGRKQAN